MSFEKPGWCYLFTSRVPDILVFCLFKFTLAQNISNMSLKKYLQQFTKEQLIEQIIELQKKYKDVKTYYEFSLNPNTGIQVEKTKKAIYKYFNSPQGYDPKLREARKEVNDLKKLSPTEESIADVMLYYVECGVKFTLDFGDINEPFYNSVAGMYYDACEFIAKNGLNKFFKIRCEKIVDDTRDMGWGFHDELSQHFFSFFEN